VPAWLEAMGYERPAEERGVAMLMDEHATWNVTL
jgi:hypothetical protein